MTTSDADEQASALLAAIGAPGRLVRHAELVGEAAEEMLDAVLPLAAVDAELVRLGARLHDAGKALHPSELDAPGTQHEDEGEALLLRHGADARVARMCKTHARWRTTPDVTLEELLVALADKLWKGKREVDLEERVIDALAARSARDRWEIFTVLDDAFERVAERGPERLARSAS